MFQSLGEGYFLGYVCQLIAEKSFDSLFDKEELHVLFLFKVKLTNGIEVKLSGKVQENNFGEHYDQDHDKQDLLPSNRRIHLQKSRTKKTSMETLFVVPNCILQLIFNSNRISPERLTRKWI